MENKRILIIDDDVDILLFANSILSRGGAEVLSAESADQGFTLASKHLPHLIICDLNMPRKSGFDFLSLKRGNSLLSDVPVLVLSGLNDRESVVKARSLGAVDYLLKPMRADSLLEKVRKCLKPTALLKFDFPAGKEPTALLTRVEMKPKALAVAGQPHFQGMLESVLTECGFDIHVTHDADEFLAVSSDVDFYDLFLVDAHLPKSLDVVSELRKRGPKARILLIGGDQNQKTVMNALESGAAEFIHRDSDPELRGAILQIDEWGVQLETQKSITKGAELRLQSSLLKEIGFDENEVLVTVESTSAEVGGTYAFYAKFARSQNELLKQVRTWITNRYPHPF